MATSRPTGRGRGQRAGLDLRQIIDAAKTLDADAPTMQAVADVLGVDRKALNHYVQNRQRLLEILAMDSFLGGIASHEVATAESWQDACRAFAAGITDGVLAAGRLGEHLWFGESHSVLALEATEALFAHLAKAGFADEVAVRLVTMLSTLCLSHARDVAQAADRDLRPRAAALQADLSSVRGAEFTHLARISALGVDTYDRAQLQFSVNLFLAGAATVLRAA